ncbi:MAG TPA: galactosyltransferase-related protein, partial [Quisquiliibacterium sp.]|nr:galactosyltransferase-related protein [Quisquiliibacterium sp.]
EPGRFHRAGAVGGVRDLETFGTVVCPRRAFDAIGGYDEAMRGWGGEDVDLYTRLSQIGLVDSDYPAGLLDVIRHDDDLRTRWHEIKDRRRQDVVNHCYLAAKSQLMAFRGPGKPLELEVRTRLLEQTRRQLESWNGDEDGPLPVLKYTLAGGGWLPPPFVMRRQVQLTIQLERRRGGGPGG